MSATDNGNADAIRTLEALATRLRDVESVAGAAVHELSRPWLELVAQRPLGAAVLREIADHHCGIDETAVDNGIIMATILFISGDGADE